MQGNKNQIHLCKYVIFKEKLDIDLWHLDINYLDKIVLDALGFHET